MVDHGPFFIQPPPEAEADSLLGQRVCRRPPTGTPYALFCTVFYRVTNFIPEPTKTQTTRDQVRKHFPGHGTFDGAVVKIDTSVRLRAVSHGGLGTRVAAHTRPRCYPRVRCETSCIGRQARPHFYKVAFDDGDHEEYTLPELKKLLLLGDGAGATERIRDRRHPGSF